jgi:deoxyguanosine kinase
MSGVRAFVGLGANLGDREAALRRAVGALAAAAGVEVVAASLVYEGPAHTLDPAETQPPFLNAVVELRTGLTPEALLAVLHAVERGAGRERRQRWAPRSLDLDLLLYDGLVNEGSEQGGDTALTLPHPRIAERRFVLQPLHDLDPALGVPGTGRTVAELLAACPDPYPLTPTEIALMPAATALPDALRYVAVEGVIGAGKTSLARMLAERMGARLVLEEFEENPFLPDFYREPERWAFHTQLAFLASRFRQQKTLLERDLFQQRTVSDYTFDKDRIFAHLTLSGDELLLYENVFGLMEPATATPDLVVYLQSSADRLMHNVAQRGRPYEKNMERSYLEALSSSYDAHFGRYQKGPLLIVDASAIDFVNHPEDFERLVARIAAMAGQSGTVRFTPPATLELDFS